MSNKKVLISLLAGAAAGTIAGLLLAPDSGKNSRTSLKNSATKIGDDLKTKSSKWTSDLDRIVRDGLAKVQDASAKLNVGELVASGKKSAEDLLGSFSSEVSGKSGGSSVKATAETAAVQSEAHTNPGTSPS